LLQQIKYFSLWSSIWTNLLFMFQPAYVVHIFPPCDFSQTTLQRLGFDLLYQVKDLAHLIVIIATVAWTRMLNRWSTLLNRIYDFISLGCDILYLDVTTYYLEFTEVYPRLQWIIQWQEMSDVISRYQCL